MIYYEKTGSGPPILFLHSLGSSHEEWNYQKQLLSAHYTVITPDLRGHGKSIKHGPFTIKQHVLDIQNLHLGPVVVVGFSYGACVALQLALQSPELVKSLILISPTSRIQDINYWQRLWRWILITCTSMQTIAKAIAFSLFPRSDQTHLRLQCEEHLAANDKKIYKALCEDLETFDVTGELHTITCPALLIVGEHDPLLPRFHAEKMLARLPHAKLEIIAGARHAVTLDSPYEFMQLLVDHLTSITPVTH